MRKIAQKLVAGALAAVLVATAVPVGPALTAQAATRNMAVKNQKQLVKALNTPSVKTVTINGGNSLKIPTGDYEKKTLVVDAGKVKVTNNGDFNKVNVKNATAFKENGSENTLKVTDNKLTLTVGKKADGTVVNVAKKGADLNLVNNGNLQTITVSKAASLSVSGKSTNEVEIVNKASGSVIETAVASKLTLNKAADITVADGAKVSSIDAKAESTISVESGASVETISAGGNADVKIAEGATVNEIGVTAENSTVNVDVKGTLNSASVDAAASLNVTGSGAEEKPVAITANAEGASVKTEVPATITLNENATVTVAEGAEGSSINANGEAKAEVTNSSKEVVSVTTTDASGNTTTSKPINPGANSTVSGTTGTDSGKDTTTTGGGSSSGSYSGGGGYSVTTYPISYDLSELTALGLDTTAINLPSSYVAGRATSIQAPQYSNYFITWTRIDANGNEIVEDGDTRLTYYTHIELWPTTSGPLYFKANAVAGTVGTITVKKGKNICVSGDYYNTGVANTVQRAYPKEGADSGAVQNLFFWYPFGGTLPTVKVNNSEILVGNTSDIHFEEYTGNDRIEGDFTEYCISLPGTADYTVEIGDVEDPAPYTLTFEGDTDSENVLGFFSWATMEPTESTTVKPTRDNSEIFIAVKNGKTLQGATIEINGDNYSGEVTLADTFKPINQDLIRLYKLNVKVTSDTSIKIKSLRDVPVLTVTTNKSSENSAITVEANTTFDDVARGLLGCTGTYAYEITAMNGEGMVSGSNPIVIDGDKSVTYNLPGDETGTKATGNTTVLEADKVYTFYVPVKPANESQYSADATHVGVYVKVAAQG